MGIRPPHLSTPSPTARCQGMDNPLYTIADTKAFLQNDYFILDRPSIRIWTIEVLWQIARLAKRATIPETIAVEDITVQILKRQSEYANRHILRNFNLTL